MAKLNKQSKRLLIGAVMVVLGILVTLLIAVFVTRSADDSKYIGLTEKAALAKAKQSNIPARVVKRDDEALPVTMDFVSGRYNFYVRDGKVYSVEVEQ